MPYRSCCKENLNIFSPPHIMQQSTHRDITYVRHITRTFKQSVQLMMLQEEGRGGTHPLKYRPRWWKWDWLWNANCSLCAGLRQKLHSWCSMQTHDPISQRQYVYAKMFFFIEMMRSGLLEVSWDIGTIKWQNVRKLKKTSIEFQALSCYKNDSKVELVQQII